MEEKESGAMKMFSRKKNIANPQRKAELKKERYLLIISGILLGISFPPSPFPYFLFAALVPFFIVLEKRESLAEINRATYITAFVFSLLTVYWVGGFVVAKDPFLMVSGFLLLFFNPIFFLIPSTLFYYSKNIFPKTISFLLFPFFWVTYEYAYMLTDISFPWLTLGNGLSHFLTFIQIADYIGSLGLTLIVIFINVFIFFSLTHYKANRKLFAIFSSLAVTLILVPMVYGWIKLFTAEFPEKKITIALVQPNLDPYEKWSGGSLEEITNLYINLSRDAYSKGAQFFIWPETALPVYLLSGSYDSSVDSIINFVTTANAPLLTGMPDIRFYNSKEEGPPDVKHSKESNYYYSTYNAIFLFSPTSDDIQRYGKMKLVPFGERTPFANDIPFFGDLIKWGVGLSGWNVGQDTTVFTYYYKKGFTPDSIKVNGLICYESVYPDFVAAFAQRGAEFIAVVTNDSWYGNTSGPYQHKEISVLRAVENRRSVVRSANGGISCIIDQYGRTVVESKMYEKTVVIGDVHLNSEQSFFTRYPKIAANISSVISILIVGLFFLFKGKKYLIKRTDK